MSDKRMRGIIIFIMVLLTGVNVSAHQTADRKVSPWLRQAINQQQATRRTAGGQEPLTVVFLQTATPLSDDQLAQHQARRYAQLDDIAIVMLPLSEVDALSAEPDVLHIEANEQAHPTLDLVSGQVNVSPIYQQTAQRQAFTGDGVVMGVMDVGFDLTHPNWFHDGQYRIGAFWDMLAPTTDTDRLPVGSDFVGSQDILARGCATDGRQQNHGTHTLGIAGGGGYLTPYRGMAYESDLCIVSNAVSADTVFIAADDYYKYTTATDALGFKYLFDYAERQQKPCVVSFSEGYSPYIDRDDSLFAAFLGKLQGPGRILVASAGNVGNDLTYVDKPAGTEAAGAFLRCTRKTAAYRVKADGPVAIRLLAYEDQSSTPTRQLDLSLQGRALNDTLRAALSLGDHQLQAELFRYPMATDVRDTLYILQLKASVALNQLPPVALTLVGSNSRAELYGTSASALKNADTDPRWNHAESSHNILAPGCFPTVFCVGATTHRQQYVNQAGQTVTLPYPADGRLADYSSTGPALNGVGKPDVTAPGTYVISSYSSYYLEEHPTHNACDIVYSDVDVRRYPWSINSGTSMSTPVVAGTIALWLQARPTLTPDDIRGVLSRTCSHPDGDLTYPNNRYGFGEIDGYRGLLDILGLTAIPELSHHEAHGVRIAFDNGLLRLRFDGVPTAPIDLRLYSLAGQQVFLTRLQPESSDVSIPLPPLSAALYAVQLTAPGTAFSGSQLVRIPRP